MPERLDNLLTIKEVTDLLHVHPNTLRNWEKDGLINVVRIGPRGDRRYKRQMIEQLVNQNQNV
jgi:DNA-binding transcriptional MerR regulator